jgi:DNA-binding response OmpR family regulator
MPVQALLVEDDPSIAALITEVLVESGYNVTHVWTPEEALGLARTQRWDLFLVDSFGRGHRELDDEGAAFLRSFASHGPVIVCTAREWATHAHADDVGVDAIVLKPFDVDKLAEVVSSTARTKRTALAAFDQN